MKNRINFSSHSGNIRIVEPSTNLRSFNKINNQNNYFKNTISQNERNRNSKTPENKRIKKTSSSDKTNLNDITKIDFSPQTAIDLVYNINDDFQTLIYKNSKLREFIVRANETIVGLVIYIICNIKENSVEEVKRQSELEKQDMILQLDRITNNYKLYSDYYSKYFELIDKMNLLENDYRHNLKVMNIFKETIK
jgi:hypothetical protein